MDRKTVGTVLGVIAVAFWFSPLAYVSFMGEGAYQAGHHIGGIAYLLLSASLAYSALSWLEQHVLRIIAGSVALAISALFLFQAGSSAAWGLYGLILASASSIALAVQDNKASSFAPETRQVGQQQ